MEYLHLRPKFPARLFVLIASLFLSLATVSIAHPADDQEHRSCLARHLKIAQAMVGDLSKLNFDIERDGDHLYGTASASNQRAKTSNNYSLPVIFYSSNMLNIRPIITMAGDRLTAVEAMAVQYDKVIAVGPLTAVRRKAGNRRFFVNLESQVILPGFVEPHLHIILSALLKGYLLDIGPLRAPSFKDAMSQLKAQLRNVTEGEWLVGYGYDPSRLNWHDLSSKDLDDNVSSKVPILVINASGHLAYANTKAFSIANVTKDTPNPEGGEYAKDSDGNLTGVLVEQGAIGHFSAFATVANQARAGLIAIGIQKVISQWLSKGITSVFDAGLGTIAATDLDVIANLTKVSPIRISAAVANFKPGDAEKMLGNGNMPSGGYKRGNLTVETIKLWADGSTQGFTAAVKSSYLPKHFPEYFGNRTNGVLVWPDGQKNPPPSVYNSTMYAEMVKWMKRGYQIMIHSNGDLSTQIVLDNFEKISVECPELFKMRKIHRMEHFTVTEISQVQRARRLGLGISHTMGHVHFWGDAFREGVLGKKRAERIDPVRDDVRSGVLYSFNSDSPVTDADPLLWVSTAITRKVYKTGNVLGQAQKVGLEEALRGVTSFPARQIMREKEVGTLQPGKKADFVVLSEDVRTFNWEKRAATELEVTETWIGGQRVYAQP
ncbi:hypothetical protein ABW20_dc0107729 [Dactylellina cionopaga]|nr:hypothetical protein ABW20_dc0107729 [Dactylellina cionopaga]